jgi:hypothetical protein
MASEQPSVRRYFVEQLANFGHADEIPRFARMEQLLAGGQHGCCCCYAGMEQQLEETSSSEEVQANLAACRDRHEF